MNAWECYRTEKREETSYSDVEDRSLSQASQEYMIVSSLLEDQYELVSKENCPGRGRSVGKAGFHCCLVTSVMEWERCAGDR